MTYITEKKLQKDYFLAKKHCLFGDYRVHGNVHTYVTTKELKTMAFRINSQNITQKFGIQVTFILEIKPQKECFLIKYDCFFGDLCVHFDFQDEVNLDANCLFYFLTTYHKCILFLSS